MPTLKTRLAAIGCAFVVTLSSVNAFAIREEDPNAAPEISTEDLARHCGELMQDAPREVLEQLLAERTLTTIRGIRRMGTTATAETPIVNRALVAATVFANVDADYRQRVFETLATRMVELDGISAGEGFQLFDRFRNQTVGVRDTLWLAVHTLQYFDTVLRIYADIPAIYVEHMVAVINDRNFMQALRRQAEQRKQSRDLEFHAVVAAELITRALELMEAGARFTTPAQTYANLASLILDDLSSATTPLDQLLEAAVAFQPLWQVSTEARTHLEATLVGAFHRLCRTNEAAATAALPRLREHVTGTRLLASLSSTMALSYLRQNPGNISPEDALAILSTHADASILLAALESSRDNHHQVVERVAFLVSELAKTLRDAPQNEATVNQRKLVLALAGRIIRHGAATPEALQSVIAALTQLIPSTLANEGLSATLLRNLLLTSTTNAAVATDALAYVRARGVFSGDALIMVALLERQLLTEAQEKTIIDLAMAHPAPGLDGIATVMRIAGERYPRYVQERILNGQETHEQEVERLAHEALARGDTHMGPSGGGSGGSGSR